MQPREIKPQSLADGLFRQLASEILDGHLPPGSKLPPERQLAEDHGVNRHVVREAIKRAEQIGLVRSRQGGGTTVLDFERTAGLDALALLSEYAAEDLAGARLWRAAFEMRAAIGTDLARLCALRADDTVKRELIAIAHQLKSAPRDVGIVALDLSFWELMLDGADNVAYRLAYNSLIRSAQAAPERQLAWTIAELESSDFRMPIAQAIAEGDSAAAEAATRTSLRGAIVAIDAAVAEMAKQQTENTKESA
jgi:DNA-binding FadR family transcriptional regulator